MLAYLLVRVQQAGPSFLFKDGIPLTRQRFVQAVQDTLEKAASKPSIFWPQLSYWSCEAAMTAASRGMEDSIITGEEFGKLGISQILKAAAVGKLFSPATYVN